VPLQLVFEPLPIEGDLEVAASPYQAVARREKGGGEGNRIAYRTPHLEMELTRQRDMDQCGP